MSTIDFYEFYRLHGKCCATGKPMNTSKNLNVVSTQYAAHWKHPVMTNVQYINSPRLAVGIVHDCCIDDATGKIRDDIKYCIEWTDNRIIYHPVAALEVHEAYRTNGLKSKFIKR